MTSRDRHRTAVLMAVAALACLADRPLFAGGGPRNVLVVVNEDAEESLEIGNHYLRARGIPGANLCRLRTTTSFTTSQATFQSEIREPIRACIAASPYAARIDYIVLTRGLPIRVSLPDTSNPPTTPTSITALLQVMDTSIRDKNQEYGAPYRFQFYPNPYRGRDEYFSHSKTFGTWGPLYLSTMLSGYWSEDAIALVDRSLASDGTPPSALPGATFFLEEARPAADVRNADFPLAATRLQSRGLAATRVRLADPDVTGAVVASHLNGGTYSDISRPEIESNVYPPGAIVDVLESFGLTPPNFTPGGQDQVPGTWWVTAGATGVHGTVFEPYNVAFPDGFMLEPYVDGYNLAEAWYQGIPYSYWMNLVLGDPLCQPWAALPAVTIENPAQGASVSGNIALRASAVTPRPEGIGRMEFFIDDTLVHTAPGSPAQRNWASSSVADGWHRFEAVAYENSKYCTQGTAGVEFLVQNNGLAATITSPPAGSVVAGVFPVEITASPSVTSVEVRAEGLLLGTAAGTGPFTVNADSALLGRGTHTLVARGRTAAALEVRSAGVPVTVEKSPRLHGTLAPDNGPADGGTAVTIEGWNFEPPVRVFFGAGEAAVSRSDANHMMATTPPGTPGVVDVRIENPVAPPLLLPAAFTYTPSPCAVTGTAADLRVSLSAGSLSLRWSPLSDPCLDGYLVFTAADPPSAPPFPSGWSDVTAADSDADPRDLDFSHAPPGAGLLLYQVTGRGTDGTPGPP